MGEKLGIAITTYNRRDMILSLCRTIRESAAARFDLVVCDDGSTDGTVEALKTIGVAVVGGRNGGIARNKNRGIWHLLTHAPADTILLLDDDMIPARPGWEQLWIDAARRWGHINYSFPATRDHILDGDCTPETPGLTRQLGGCAVAFRRDVLAGVGFFDPRFHRYGHEHTDLTVRAIRGGHGGRFMGRGALFYVIDGGMALRPSESNGTRADVSENSKIWETVTGDQIYRHAWRDDAERAEFLAETEPL